MSPPAAFKNANELYYRWRLADIHDQAAAKSSFDAALEVAVLLTKCAPETLRSSIVARSGAYWGARQEGFTPEQAFEIASKAKLEGPLGEA